MSAPLAGPWAVGKDAFLCVGIGGKVTAVEDDWLEIEGHRLPLRLGAGLGVRYISTEYPTDPTDAAPPCADCDVMREEMDRDSLRWNTLAREVHNDEHDGAWMFCRNALCREAQQ